MNWQTRVPIVLLAFSGFAHADIGEDCSEPLVLSGSLPIMTSGDTTGLSDEYDFGDEQPCAGGGTVGPGTAVGPDAVYAVQPSEFCDLTVTLTSDSPTVLSLYVLYNCENVPGACGGIDYAVGNGGTAQLTFPAFPDGPVYIVVDGTEGSAGPYTLDVEEATATGCSLMPIDLCDIPPVSASSFFVTDSTTTRADKYDIGPGCGLPAGAGLGGDNVHRYQPFEDARVRVTFLPEGSAELSLYVATDCTDITGSCIAATGAPAVANEQFEFTATAGQMYYFFVDGYNGDSGDYRLLVEATRACCLPGGCMDVLYSFVCEDLGGIDAGPIRCTHPDSDQDGVPNVCDGCVFDPLKFDSGACGCGIPGGVTGAAFQFRLGGYGSQLGQFNDPQAISTDSDGNIYVADTGNHRVQVFDDAGNFLFTFGSFGDGNGEFDTPRGIVVFSNGKIFVSDFGNARIQQFTAGGSFAGEASAPDPGGGSSGNNPAPGIAGLDGDEDETFALHVADRYQDLLWEVPGSSTFGQSGSGPGQFHEPVDLARDSMGRFVIADQLNARIQVLASDKSFLFEFDILNANGQPEGSPEAVAVDADDNIYVTESTAHVVQVFDSAGTFQFSFGSFGDGPGQFNQPHGIDVDDAGRILVTDLGNDRVQVFNSLGQLFIFGSDGSGTQDFDSPEGIDVDAAGQIYVVDGAGGGAQVYDSTGTYLRPIGALAGTIPQFQPLGIAVDSAGRVAMSDGGNNNVHIFGPFGEYQRSLVDSGTGSVSFNTPRGLDFDQDGRLIVADTNANRIKIFSPVGDQLIVFGSTGSGAGAFTFPRDVATDQAGNIYVADTGNHRVQVFDSAGVFLFTFGTLGTGPGQFNSPRSIDVDRAGRIHVADAGNDRFQVFDSAGTHLYTYDNVGTSDGQLNAPSAIAVDSSGRIVTAELSTERVQAFDLILDCPCPGDANGDLTVDLADLLAVIGNWGSDGSGGGDVNDDNSVDLADLLAVIGNWGTVCN